MRFPPNPDGGRHRPDYVAQTSATILSENVHLSYDITVGLEPAGSAAVVSPLRIVPRSALRAVLACIGLFLEFGLPPAKADAFVLQIRPDSPERSLMEPLVLHFPAVVPDPDVAHVADDELSDASFMERLYPRRRQLVLDVSDLVVDLAELPLLGPDQFLAAFSSFLLVVDSRGQLPLNALAVAALGTKETTVQDDVKSLRPHDGRMNLAKIDGSDIAIKHFFDHRLIGNAKLVATPVPSDFSLNGFGIEPVLDDERNFAFRVGKNEVPVLDLDCLILPDDLVEPLALPRRPKIGVDLPGFSPCPDRGVEALDGLLRRLGMKNCRLAVGDELLKRGLGKPDILSTDDPPEPDLRKCIDPAGFGGKPVQDLQLSKLPFADEIHGLRVPLVLDVFLHGLQAHAPDRGDEVAVRPKGRKTGTEPRVPFPEIMARSSLHPLDDAVDSELRVAFDERVDMIGHDLNFDDLGPRILGNGKENRLEFLVHWRLENGTPVLRAPDDMVSAKVDDVVVAVIFFHLV